MLIAQDDSLVQRPEESIESFNLRRWYIVEDDYDFGANNATNVTSFDAAVLFYSSGRLDFKQHRKMIAIVAAVTGWSNLSLEQKQKASSIFAVQKSYRDEVHTAAEQEANSLIYHTSSIQSREARMTCCEAKVYNRLLPADADVVINDMKTYGLTISYIRHGREGIEEGDAEGVLDYIQATEATTYELTGLVTKGFTPITGSLQDLVDELVAIIKDGVAS